MEGIDKSHLEEMNKEQALNNGNQPINTVPYDVLHFNGLTKREHMSTQILNGFVSHYGEDCNENLVTRSVELADMLLIELYKKKI
jgi:hypothetical protein